MSRIVCLVPSWTETLVRAGLHVVGRTRFCIHPADQVRNIAAVGGTKDANWQKIAELKPDFIVLDKEENPKEFYTHASKIAVPVVTHVVDLASTAHELSALGVAFDSRILKAWSSELAQKISGQGLAEPSRLLTFKHLPVLSWLTELPTQSPPSVKVVYVIWQNPWMAVGPQTYIASLLRQMGLSVFEFDQKYPKIEIEDFCKPGTVFLFSSEPFPFHKKIPAMDWQGASAAVVDGELFSWFGWRTLQALSRIEINHY